ncbi:MAG: hypothetical protein AB1776_08540 [Bacillota bacterium]
MKKLFEKLKSWAEGNPRAFFLALLAGVVGLTFVLAAALPENPRGQEAPRPPERQQEAAGGGEAKAPLTPLVNGPVKVEAFAGGLTEVTLGGILPTGECLVVRPQSDWESDWGRMSVDAPGDVGLEAATVSYPLGGKYARLSVRVGFLPPRGDARWGGRYEIYLDGRRVWEKTVRPEDVAAGRAADEALSLDLRGVKVLTFRLQGTVARYWQVSSYSYSATVPYPMVLYEVQLEKAGGN